MHTVDCCDICIQYKMCRQFNVSITEYFNNVCDRCAGRVAHFMANMGVDNKEKLRYIIYKETWFCPYCENTLTVTEEQFYTMSRQHLYLKPKLYYCRFVPPCCYGCLIKLDEKTEEFKDDEFFKKITSSYGYVNMSEYRGSYENYLNMIEEIKGYMFLEQPDVKVAI